MCILLLIDLLRDSFVAPLSQTAESARALLLFSSLFPIYECLAQLLSVCKHTTRGQNPMHIFSSHPIKHTLNNLLWSLFRRAEQCIWSFSLAFVRRHLHGCSAPPMFEFYVAKMMRHKIPSLLLLKMNFWSAFYRLVISDIVGGYCFIKWVCSWYVLPHMARESFIESLCSCIRRSLISSHMESVLQVKRVCKLSVPH